MAGNYQHGGDIYRNEVLYDFSVNTNPIGMPEKSKEAAIAGISMAKCYPDSQAQNLREAIARQKHLHKEEILVGNGAAELIYSFCQGVRPKKGLALSPCFQEYEEAMYASEGKMEFFPLSEKNDFLLKEDFIEQITEDVDVVFLCNPNNPTGQLISRKQLENIARRCEKTRTWFCLDECFLPFLEEEKAYSMMSEIDHFPHMIILRAFTKIYGMAGLRLGYAVTANKALRERIRQVLQPWNTSIPAQMAGIAALEDVSYLQKTRKMIQKERQYLMGEMGKNLAKKIYPSAANYILFQAQKDLKERLLEKKIMIRSCDNYRNLTSGFFRIAVRTRKENQALIEAWNALKGEKNGK